MLLIHLCFFLFSFLCLAFCSYLLFYFCSHALLLALLYMFLLFCSIGFWEWMGKGIASAVFFGSIRKRRKLYMFLVMLSSGFFERFVRLLWGVGGGLSPLGFVGKEGTFWIFGLGKGYVYGVLEGWNSGTFWICYVTFFFLFYLICQYWIVLKNSQCYCPLYLDR